MSDDSRKKPRKGAIDIDLGGLLGNLGEVLGEAVQKLTEAGEAAAERFQETETSKGPIRSHAGVRIRMGGLEARSAGPKPVNPDRPKSEAPVRARPLVAELIEDGATWVVTAEMPGVAAEEVRLAMEGRVLSISSTGARAYAGDVTLPAACAVDAIAVSLVNDILTLRPGAAA